MRIWYNRDICFPTEISVNPLLQKSEIRHYEQKLTTKDENSYPFCPLPWSLLPYVQIKKWNIQGFEVCILNFLLELPR